MHTEVATGGGEVQARRVRGWKRNVSTPPPCKQMGQCTLRWRSTGARPLATATLLPHFSSLFEEACLSLTSLIQCGAWAYFLHIAQYAWRPRVQHTILWRGGKVSLLVRQYSFRLQQSSCSRSAIAQDGPK